MHGIGDGREGARLHRAARHVVDPQIGLGQHRPRGHVAGGHERRRHRLRGRPQLEHDQQDRQRSERG
ncbi:MAG: hypothetical protein ACJ710_07505 [Ornithinibacter sp.]